jgi:hypothetical protein
MRSTERETSIMNAREVAEQISRDATCAKGEFNQRVLSIIPYLTEHADEIRGLRAIIDKAKYFIERGDERMALIILSENHPNG